MPKTSATKGARLALVTGATGNLGGAVMQTLQASGTRVVAVERAQVRFEGEVLAQVELADAASIAAAIAHVAQRLGPIDAVVHTVGTYRGGRSLLDTSSDDFVELFATNVLTTANVVRAALVHMLPRQQGQIAVVASADALQAVAGQSAYGASKAAQLRMVESAAAEIRGRGVTLNAVLPGTMDTAQNRAAMSDADRSRWVSLEAVAEVLAFLVSPAAAAIHGQAVRVGA